MKEVRLREKIPLLELGTVQQWGETKGIELVAVEWHNLAKLRRLKKSRKLWEKIL